MLRRGANGAMKTFEMTNAHWDALGKSGDAHKHRYGRVAVVSGPAGQGGAARLAARGALRIGAGVVTVLCAPDAVGEHAAHLDAIMVKSVAPENGLSPVLAAMEPQAVCIGPNLGLGPASQASLADAIRFGAPMCIDADAITLMADLAISLPALTNARCVMTPHEGELRRLIPDTFEQTTCRVTLAQTAADKTGCVVLFKGPDTIVAPPRGPAIQVSSAPYPNAAWLATAGSGDVLAGFVTGLLARGFDPVDAATIASDLHFRCADAFGPGLIAEDLPEMLPRVLR